MEVPNFRKNRLSQLIAHGLTISGRGGSKGGGGSRTPVEANDTVNSRAMASVLDLLGEGVIGGLVDGAKSIFLNDTPLQNSDNSYNFSGVTWWFRDGSQDQSVIDGFDFIETPKSVGRQLKQTSQVNVSLDSADSDRVRVVMKFPSLRSIDKKSGDTNGTTVQFKFQIDASNGKGFVDVVAEGESSATISLTAKKTGVYYRSYVIDLPKPAKSYTLRAIRLTEDHTDNSYLYDDTYIDSIGEIVNTSLNYPNSALVGLKINSEQFGSTMPSRSYLIKGLKIRVPSNYNADTNTYNGNWDGTFKLASSSNPAWILFDLLTNTRYGLGQFVQESMINIGELYQIGRYCDATVDDGFGGKEKRFAINTQITSRQDAYRVVQDIAGAFRGMVYWAGGMVHVTQDSPADPVMLFSNSNVVNGSFAYKGSARKDRYSVALITYNNKEDGYKQSVEYVEDQEAIKRYGIRKTESVAFGCTSRGQAHRVGLWTLYTSRMESDVITFAVGMDSVFLMPGDIVLIADKFRAGRRNSGRITGYTSNSIKLDAPVDLTSVGNHITFLSAEGKMVERDILENGKNITTVTFKTALSSNETPVNDAVWVIAQPDLTPLQARVVNVAEGEDGTSFNITAIQNNPTKYEAIDSGAQLIPQNTTVLDPTFSKPSGLTITEGTYLSSPGNLSVSLTATWQGKSAQYYISWRRSDAGNVSNWKSERVTEEQFELRGVAENGQYDFQVYAVSVGGRKTDPISITYKVLGTMTAPDAPTGLTAVGDYRSIVLNWVNPASVDLDHIEVLASKTNDKSKAQLIAKVSGTTFSHNGLEDSVTWYYWVRAANKRGMLSSLNSPLATTATTRDVLSFLKNKITESELGQSLITDIDSKAVAAEVDAAIDDAKSQATNQVNDARVEAANAVSQAQKTLDASIKQEAVDRKNAVADEAKQRAKAVADEASARAKAVADEASARASAISDSVAFEANARAKAISDSASTLSTKIDKEASDRAAAVSALDTKTANALSSETSNRIAAISDEAKARADAILQEQNSRKSDISTLKTQVQTSTDSLAQQISQVAAGTGEQFDSLNIWYFDTSNEGWTEDDNGNTPMSVTSDGWLKSANSTASYRSPNNMAIDAAAYRFVKLRLKKVGSPVWAGKLLWIGASEGGWSDTRSLTINEPEYDANGVATLTIHDIDWRSSETIRRFRFDFLKNQDSKNYVQIDWIAVGRPTPGAGMAALQAEQTARTNADAAEAANRNTLAVQIRGSYDGNDLSKVSSGLIFQEQQARVTADKAEATARQSLETKVNDSVSSINKSLDTLNTQDKAMASDISGLKSSLGNKADASALQTLKTTVDQQGSNISTQGQSITKLQNDLNTTNTNVGKKADQTALVSLQGTVTQQGKDITSANSSITNLKTSLDATNSNLAKKADASAVGDLSSRVSATENKVSSQGDSIVQLNNSLNNALADSDASSKTPNNLIVNPSFERGTDGYIGVSSLSTVVTIQIPHVGTKALKIDPGSPASPGQYIDFVKDRTYEIGVWVKQVSGTTDNGQGNNKLRVGNSAGAPVLEIPFVNLTVDWTKISKRWKATETGSLPVTLSNYLTAGNRYFDDFYVIDVTDSIAIDANASALSSLQNTVTQQGKDISSQSTSITSLNNSLKTTNDNVAKKADSSTVQTLQNTVTQQGKDISAATSDISSLKNSLATTNGNVAKKADASALQSLQNTVTQQGKDLTSVGSRTTALENNLKATNDNVAKKADATALSTLQNTVTQQGNSIASQSDSITSLKNSVGSLVNMGDNLVQDANFDNGGQTFRTQQNSGTSGSVVEFGAFGENSAGVRMVKVNSTSPGLFANGKLPVPVNGARKYRYIVRAKGVSGAMNMLLRRWNFNGNTEGAYEDKNNTLTTDWQTITWDTSFSPKDGVDGQSFGIYCHPANAEIWIDSFQVFDITDAFNNDATGSALSELSSKVSQQGSTVTSQGAAITKLVNDLNATNGKVNQKADATAVTALANRVTATEKDISSQADSITKLTSDLVINSRKGSNPWLDGSFETYADDANLGGSARVVNGVSHSGNKSMRTRRAANTSGNSDDFIGSRISIGDTSVFRFEFWAMMPKDQAPSNGWSTSVGLNVLRSTDNANNWIAAVAINEANLGGRDTWTKFVGYAKVNVANANRAVIWVSNRGANGANTPGYDIYFDDLVVTDVTDAYNAQGTADAAASAVSNLSTKVDQQGNTITAQGNSITKLNSDLTALSKDVDTKASASAVNNLTTRVTKAEDTITSQGNSITKLTNDLNTTNGNVNKKADASTVQALQQTVTQQGKDISSQGSSITGLENNLSLVNADLNNITTPGNLITNATFERGDQGYFGFNGSVSIDVLQAPHSGTHAMKVTGTAIPGQNVNFTKDRTYEIGVWVKQLPGTTDNGPGNNKLRIGNSSGNPVFEVPYNTADTNWRLFSKTWKATETAYLPVTLNNGSVSGSRYFDELYVIDITDRVQIDANATAINSLTNTVKQQGNTITSQGTAITTLDNKVTQAQKDINSKASASAVDSLSNRVTATEKSITSQGDSITKLTNDLNTTKGDVSKKADQTALNALSGRVSQTESGLEAANSSITSLGVAIRAGNASSGDLIPNPTFDPAYNQMGFNVVSSSSDGVPSGCPFNNVAKLTGRDHHPKFDNIPATLGDVYEITALVACGTGNAAFNLYMATALSPTGGVGQPLFNKTQAVTSTWTRVTWRLTVNQAMVNRGFIRPFLQINQSSPFGTVWYVTDWHMRNITAAAQAQDSADATGKAVDSLTTTVNQQGKDISSIGSRTTSLENGLSTTNANVSKKADASALQTLQNTVTQQGKDLSSQGASLTQLTNSLNATNDSIDASGQIPGNMITNASFERDNGGYSTWSGPVSVMVAQSPRTGKKILKIVSGSPALVGQKITYVKGRTYKIGMWARQESNTTINGGTSNTKFRVADSAGLIASFGYGPFTTSWQEISWIWTATKDMVADTQITASLNAGAMYFDDFYVIDITDRVDLDATSSALSSLTSRVTNAEGKVTTNSSSITTLNNTVSSLNKTVAAKADTSALQSLQNTVTQQGKDLTAASGNITSLQSSLSQVRKQGANLVIDGSFETLNPNGNLSIFTGDKHSGNRCARFRRGAATNSGGNNDVNYGEWFDLRASQVVYVEIWAKLDAENTVKSPGGYANVGMQWQDSAQKNNWPAAFQIRFDSLTTSWQKFSGYVRVGADAFRGILWMSIPQNTTNIQGYSFLIDDVIIMDATEGYNAQQTANAASTAVSDLSTKVTAIDGKITAQTSQLTSMQSKVDASSSKVDQLSKTISDSQSTQASLNTSLQSQIDAQASANIKNQADLNSATTSIASIKSTQATQATQISAMVKTQTDMTASLNSQSASIQTLQEAVSNNDALNSTWMVKMQTNNNGQKYAAGIALGVDGKNMQSQFLVQADRFALINTSNGNTTTPFVIDNGVTYMNAAFIKDGSIGSAKVGDLMSSNFQENVRGWRISRDGTMNINGSGPGSSRTVITNGRIEVYDSNNRLRVRMGIF